MTKEINIYINGKWFNGDELTDLLPIIKIMQRLHDVEAWIYIGEQGPAILLMKNRNNVFLVAGELRNQTWSVSQGNPNRKGLGEFRLSNGQVDEHELSRCIKPKKAFKAFEFFLISRGKRDPRITWKHGK